VTIVVEGADINVALHGPQLKEWCEQNTLCAYLAVERGEVERHLHFQMMIAFIITLREIM